MSTMMKARDIELGDVILTNEGEWAVVEIEEPAGLYEEFSFRTSPVRGKPFATHPDTMWRVRRKGEEADRAGIALTEQQLMVTRYALYRLLKTRKRGAQRNRERGRTRELAFDQRDVTVIGGLLHTLDEKISRLRKGAS